MKTATPTTYVCGKGCVRETLLPLDEIPHKRCAWHKRLWVKLADFLEGI